MKLQFIIIALSVTIVSTSVWPWESLVCTIKPTCCNSTCNESSSTFITGCRIEGKTESPSFNITHQKSCTCDSCNVTISPNSSDCSELPMFSLTLNHNYNDTCSSCSDCSGAQNISDTNTLLAKLTDCGNPKGVLCWMLIGLGCVITLLTIIILTLCAVIVYLLAKGQRYKYTPNVVLTQSNAEQNQIQEEQPPPPPQNQNSGGGQQTNLYHILDPQYDTVDNKTTQPRSEPVQYCEPEPSTQVQLTEVSEQKGLTKSGSQPSKLKTSLEKIDEQETGVFYDELTGPGYPKGLKSSEHSATSLPTAVPKYSSLHVKEGSEQEQQQELIALYSMPDKSKKKDKDGGKKAREIKLTTSHNLMVRSPIESKPPYTFEDVGMAKPNSSSPPPPELPPKPGQASSVAEKNQEKEIEDEESAYAEVSSRPIKSGPSHNRTPGAIGTTVSPLHLAAHNPSSSEREKGSFRRSYSMEGYFGSETLHQQKASDMDFRRLYDAPMTLSLHTRGMEPPQERQEDEEGLFRAS